MAKRIVVVAAISMCLLSCTKKEETAPTPVASTASKPAALSGTDGGGDGSGSSLANARALKAGESITFKVACDATTYTGPFRFTKDPETITVTGSLKTPSGVQICLGGDWVDRSGKAVSNAGLGCVDGKAVAQNKTAFEYSPGNGGNNANPVYLQTKFSDPKPAGCPSLELTLKIAP